MSTIVLERNRRALLDDLRLDRDVHRRVGALVVSTVVFGAIYGAVLGSWHGSRLALYVAIKVPMLMLTTAAITSLFNWIAAALLGLRLKPMQTLGLSLVPLAIASVVAASLAPIAWLFTTSLPGPSPAQQTLHNLLYLVHVVLIGASGVVGTSALRRCLEDVSGDRDVAARIRFAWTIVYAFVGGEIAWLLRPFVGSVFLPVVFFREDALRGNVYEFILTDIVPHLWRSL